MLHVYKHIFIASCLIYNLGAQADINSSGYQLSGYLGATASTIDNSALYNQYIVSVPQSPHNQRTDVTWGAGLAYRFLVPPATTSANVLHDLSLGWDLYTFQTGQEGPNWLTQFPRFNEYTYSTTITSLRFIVDSEWTFKPLFHYIFPFVEGGLGFSSNTLGYNASYAPQTDAEYNILNKGSQYAFAYTAGAGIKVLLNPKLQLSLRYLYTNLGRAVITQAVHLPLPAPLSMSLYTQSALVGLTYLL